MGKKKAEFKTRAIARAEKEDNPIRNFFRILLHFFQDFLEWIENIDDPRDEAYTKYTQQDLILLGMMKNACSVESMREMSTCFNDSACIKTLGEAAGHAGISEIPHYDTLNNYLERLSPSALSDLRRNMVRALLRSRDFDDAKLAGKHWRVILDGTGLFYFKEKHCPNCLREVHKDEDGKESVRYYHKVLEAKLVLADKIIISLGTEFIENEAEDVKKQDCEINAAKRLLARLKEEYPRMNICIQGDALYSAETVMSICREYNWKYLFTQKETRQRVVGESYEELEDIDKEKVAGICSEKGTGYYYNHVEKLAGKKEVMNVFEYVYTVENDSGGPNDIRMLWITNINLTKAKLEEMIKAGRGRWKIENEGFNTQKNILYKIQHLNSRNSNAMKNHYLLTQITDIVMQLYVSWGRARKKCVQTLKDIASNLLVSFKMQPLTNEDIAWAKAKTSIYLR